MSLPYIRRAYGVPAHRGGRVIYTGDGRPHHGTITGADGARLRIRLDGLRYSMPYHPTWRLEYLAAEDATGSMRSAASHSSGTHPESHRGETE